MYALPLTAQGAYEQRMSARSNNGSAWRTSLAPYDNVIDSAHPGRSWLGFKPGRVVIFQVVKVSSTSLVRPIQVESVQISLIDSIRSCLVQPGSPSRSNGQFDLAFRSPHGPCWVKCNLNGCSYRDLDREIRDLNRYPKI